MSKQNQIYADLRRTSLIFKGLHKVKMQFSKLESKFLSYFLSLGLAWFLRKHLYTPSNILAEELLKIEADAAYRMPPIRGQKRKWLPISLLELIWETTRALKERESQHL